MCTDANDAATYSSHGARLVRTFEESREFLILKQHLDAQLNTALNEPQGKTPQYATNFLWQVRVFTFSLPLSIMCVSFMIKFGVLAIRTIRNLLRNRLFSGVQVCFNMLKLHTEC